MAVEAGTTATRVSIREPEAAVACTGVAASVRLDLAEACRKELEVGSLAAGSVLEGSLAY